MWHTDIDDWTRIYSERLPIWLRALEKAESSTSSIAPEFVLSKYMRESWETGRFWLYYAARKSWAFDTIYWKYLDERFFGPRDGVEGEELWKVRMPLLSDRERNAMEPFVEKKMLESKERLLVDWGDKDATKRLAEVLFED